MTMFFKDLYSSIFNSCRISKENFNSNKDKCVNMLLAKLYLYLDVASYGYDIGYISYIEFNKLNHIIYLHINKCNRYLINMEV